MDEAPIRGIRFIHRAILAEAGKLEALAVENRNAAVAELLPFFERILHLHNTGEEIGLFPDIDARSAGCSRSPSTGRRLAGCWPRSRRPTWANCCRG
jgi:hypothetical protein